MIAIEHRPLPRVRRTDRGPRMPLVAAAIAQLLAPASPPRGPRLQRLLAAVWEQFGPDDWTVRELRLAGLVEAGEVHRLGHALARALRRGGRVGEFTLVRLDTEDRGARVWRIECGVL